MKVTTELKNLIRRSFNEKRAKIKSEIKSSATSLYEEKKKEVATSKEFKTYVKACQALYNRFEQDYKKQGRSSYDGGTPYSFRNFDGLNNVKVENIIGSNVEYYSKYNEDITTNISKEMQVLDLAQESLMIKLTYEKDFDTVKAMLAEYDIVI